MRAYGRVRIASWNLISYVTLPPAVGIDVPQVGPQWSEEVLLDTFESWRELSVAPMFQLHRLTDEAAAALEASVDAQDLRAVKAVQVRLAEPGPGRRGGAVIGISIKCPSTRPIRSKRGLLVHRYEDEPGIAVQGDLLDPGLAPPRPAGLYMTEGLRVLSMTPYNVRLCRTGAILYSYAWGGHDRRYPQIQSEPVGIDADALAALAP